MVELTSEAIWAWTCLVARFLITSLVSFVDVGIFEFSMSSVSVMCAFQEMHPLPLSCGFKSKKLLITSPCYLYLSIGPVMMSLSSFFSVAYLGKCRGGKKPSLIFPCRKSAHHTSAGEKRGAGGRNMIFGKMR